VDLPSPIQPDLTRLRVLLVDANDTSRDTLTEYCGSWRVRSDRVETLADVWSRCDTAQTSGDPYSLIVLVDDSSTRTLAEFTTQHAATGNTRDSRLVVITSRPFPGGARALAGLGVAGYAVQPCHPAELLYLLTAVWLEPGDRADSRRESRCVTIPTEYQVSDAEDPPGTALLTTAAKGAGGEVAEDGLLPGRVLLVDDSSTNRVVLLRMLQKIGCRRVEYAENGAQALAQVLTQDYDLVLMDCMMPVMDGFEATRQIRAREANLQHTPIVALTARVMPGDHDLCLAAGMDGLLAKPVTPRAVRSLLQRWRVFTGNGGDRPDSTLEPQRQFGPAISAATPQLGAGSPELVVTALKTFEGDWELLQEVVTVFRESAPARLRDLQQAVIEHSLTDVEYLAHSLKGSAASIGANRFVGLARYLEQMARNGCLLGADRVLPRLLGEFAELERILASCDPTLPRPAVKMV